ncbi:hypothetical protein FQR65_LT07478 [Abscondita terminalis]|nr:hypothetical protein FQR65_LT07478 [Abscondita terminalis]
MNRVKLTGILVFLLVLQEFSSAQKNPHWVTNRNTIVHLFEWKWTDIADECERFLQHQGYGGVQISPPTENIIVPNRPWWERYQPISYKLITRSGNEDEFLNMTTRCNAVGIRIYADIIFNHMAREPETTIALGTGGSTADPANKQFPEVPYSTADFHTTCAITSYLDETNVRYCELERLKDLNQESPYVRQQIIDLLNRLIDLGLAGFRLDAAKHMWPSHMKSILDNLNNLNVDFGFAPNSRPFIYQEVIDLGGEAISKFEYTHMGAVTEFKHSAEIGRVFRGYDKLAYLQNWGTSWGFLPSEDALIFIDNHDNQRGHGAGGSNILTYKTPKQYKMATAFMLAYPFGITRIMSSYGFEQSDTGPPQDDQQHILSPIINPDGTCGNGWICEHRWRQIYNMIKFKNVTQGTDLNHWWSDGDQKIAFCRGRKGFVAFTNSGDMQEMLQTCLPQGIYCDIISGNLSGDKKTCTGKYVHIASDGFGIIQISGNEEDAVLAIHESSQIQYA